MTRALAAVLDVAANAVLPFVFALGLVFGLIRLLRLPAGRARLAVLLLPFAKLGWDLGHGIAASAFFWAHEAGLVRESGTLQLGFGFRWPSVVQFTFVFGAIAHGRHYGLSIGDLVVLGCDRLASWCVPVLISTLALVSGALLLRRASGSARFWNERRAGRRAAIRVFWERIGGGSIEIYVTPAAASRWSVPIAGGLLQPYVCFPEDIYRAMSPAERRAALEHEMAHVRERHLIVIVTTRLLADLFWFVPGCRWLSRRVAGECELIADDRAVARGADRLDLASAILRAAEIVRRHGVSPYGEILAYALVPCEFASHTAMRVARLAMGEAIPPSRIGWRWAVLRLLVVAVALQSVLAAIVFSST